MANIWYTGPESLFTHSCYNGSNQSYTFVKSCPTSITDLRDISIYLKKTSFRVELSSAEKAVLGVKDVVELVGDVVEKASKPKNISKHKRR